MQTLCFSNPGEIDLRLITTFGANVKEGESPIGYFGTGLKYAIAVALRLNCDVTIQSGKQVLQFSSSYQTIRGKEFEMVEYQVEDSPVMNCGFTTDLGRNWEAWMAYREFWSNARDEGGVVELIAAVPEAQAGLTRVLVWGEALLAAHRQKGTFLIDGEAPLWIGEELEVYPVTGRGGIFYKGVKVLQPEEACQFRYNLVNQEVKLTEDRTARATWEIYPAIAKGLMLSDSREVVKGVLTAGENSLEQEMDFDYSWHRHSETWIDEVRAQMKSDPQKLNASIRGWIKKIDKGSTVPTPCPLDSIQQQQLDRAMAFCQNLGWDIQEKVVVTAELGDSLLGMAEDGVIYISVRCFEEGTKMLAGTLLEEHWHLTHNLRDETRRMQNFLINTICSLGERLQGEPL